MTRALEAVREEISVDAGEVDSVGGAKPEPEERPAFVTQEIDRTTGDNGGTGPTGTTVPLALAQNPTVRTEHTVNELTRVMGKVCRNCRHWNLPLGQMLMREEMVASPEKFDLWKNVVAEIAISRPELAGPEYVSDPFAQTGAEKELERIGHCSALTPLAKEDVFLHIDCFCPSVETFGVESFEPKNEDVARAIQQQVDRLRFGAAGKL